MKTILLFVVLLLSIPSVTSGQTLLDKIKNKVNSIGKSKSNSSSTFESLTLDEANQAPLANKFTSKKYTKYTYTTSAIKISKADGSVELFFKKNENGEVEAIYYGDATTNPSAAYMFNRTYSEKPYVQKYARVNDLGNFIFYENTIIKYKYFSHSGKLDFEVYGNSLPYKTVVSYIEKVDQLHEKIKQDSSKVRDARRKKELEAKWAAEEAKEKAEKEAREKFLAAEKIRRAKYSLENRVVTKIETKFIKKGTVELQPNETTGVGIVVTLDDGTIMKTKNLGGNLYPQDIMVECSVPKYEKIYGLGGEYKPLSSNTKYVGIGINKNYSYDPKYKNEISFTFKPKYKGSAKSMLTVNIVPVNEDLVINTKGGNGYSQPQNYKGRDGGDGDDGRDVTIYITKIERKGTCFNTTYWAKWIIGSTVRYKQFCGNLYIDARGGYGGHGSMGDPHYKGSHPFPKGGDGGDGGDGGNCTIILDPSAKSIRKEIKLQQGIAGNGKRGFGCFDCGIKDGPHGKYGTDGKPGKLIEKIQSVSFE